jgi:hypothetical protein
VCRGAVATRRIAGASSSLRDLCTWERLLKCAAVDFRVRALSSTSDQDRAYSLQVPLNGFVIELEDRPGSFADVTEVLAKRGVNLLVTGFASRGGGVAAFVCDDEDGARSALTEAGIDHREIPTLQVQMEDRPGEAAQISRKLADAGVNLEFWMPVESIWASFLAGIGGSGEAFTVALGVDDPDAARAALGRRVVG